MIEWVVFDKTNPPELGKIYLVVVDSPYSDERYMSVAELKTYGDTVIFYETMDYTSLHEVTHYAEINLPECSDPTEQPSE